MDDYKKCEECSKSVGEIELCCRLYNTHISCTRERKQGIHCGPDGRLWERKEKE